MHDSTNACGHTKSSTHSFDEVLSIRAEVGGKMQFAMQDLVNGLAPILTTKRRLDTRKSSTILLSVTSKYGENRKQEAYRAN